ncbi:MAG: beta-ketoacyl-ACP synthase I [Rhodobacteraceae bacterium]|jgi:3-oxoacyl-[acyl-carrier-protein] synthase-1|nr:beta-ketoacyl-ACP synthase I [Paracoccaceae bacterium]
MRRVVITGMGIVSPIGNSLGEVEASLRAGRSGISFAPDYAENGFRCQVHGVPRIDLAEHVDKRVLRFMGPGAAYSYIAMQQAIADAGLAEAEVSNDRTGLIAGSGGPSTSNFFTAFETVKLKGSPRKMGPFMVTRCMSSTVSACLATPFRIRGVNYSITSACSTTLHCIGAGAEQIQMGKQDIVFAGGGEEVDWTLSCLFDAMGAMSSKYNDTPETASRPYDVSRDGFVIAGGGGMVVLEEYERARARGARIYAEVTGYGATSDGHDMVAPSGEGGARSMRLALATLPPDRRIDYINAHGTSTPVGDIVEIRAIRDVFGDDHPPVGSTKSMTGHSLGGAGVHEVIYSLIMMAKGFLAPSINVREPDPELRPGEVITALREGVEIDGVLSNSFGFGGTNGTIVLSRMRG